MSTHGSVTRGRVLRVAFTALGLTAATISYRAGAVAPCEPAWIPTFSGDNAVGGEVRTLMVWDDGPGTGPSLYAGGVFDFAGDKLVNKVARWDGSNWSALGDGVQSAAWLNDLAVFDDGNGPALYAAGALGIPDHGQIDIVRWNGSSWSGLGRGVGGQVRALTVHDDGRGGGPALYAGGDFSSVGGLPASNVARWNGSSWSPLGAGMDLWVSALATYDDGSGAGPALYGGGAFATADGLVVNAIARWDGAKWSPLGSGVTLIVGVGSVGALAVYDDGSGSGPALYAGGVFSFAGGVLARNIARWDGSSWTALGEGVNGEVRALAVHDDGGGAGPALYAGGIFNAAGGAPAHRVARWDGTSWTPLGTGLGGFVNALASSEDSTGSALYVGGTFTVSPAGDAYLARWGGCTFSPADFDRDGVVGFADLVQVLVHWGECPGACGVAACPWDLGGDCVIGSSDLDAVLANWG